MQWGHRSHMTAAQRGPPTTGSLKVSTLASHSGRASADGSPGVADGGSCHAHAVHSCPTHAAGGSDFRDHTVRLKNSRRRRHSLRRYCNRKGQASNHNQPNHSAPPLISQLLRPDSGDCPAHMPEQSKIPALVAGRLEIDQGLCADRDRTSVAQREGRIRSFDHRGAEVTSV